MPLTSSLTKTLAPSWANRFKEQSLERGRRYALENRVRIVECGDSTITASCEGSGGNVYRQTISLRESAKGLLILVDSRCTCPVHTNCKHIAAVLLKVQETLAYPAAAQDAQLLEKLQAVLDNRVVLPQVVMDDVQPVPRLWLASVEFSAFEPRNGKMQRYIQHRAALSFNYLGNYVSGQKCRHHCAPGDPEPADQAPTRARTSLSRTPAPAWLQDRHAPEQGPAGKCRRAVRDGQ